MFIWSNSYSPNNTPHYIHHIISQKEIENAIRITKADLTPILKQYGQIYVDSIADEQVTKEKTTFTQGNTSIKATELQVTFTEDQFISLEKKLAKQLAEDEALLSLLHSRYENLYKLYEEAGYLTDDVEFITKDDMKDLLEDFSDALLDEIDYHDIPDGITMTLIIDPKHNILERQIIDNYDDTTITYQHWTDNNKTENIKLSLENEYDENIDISYSNTSPSKDSATGSLRVRYKSPYESSRFTVDFDVSGNEANQKGTFDFTLRDSNDKLTGTLTTEVNKIDKGFSTNNNLKLDIDIPEADIKNGSLNLGLKSTRTFDTKVTIPNLKENNTLDLVDMTDEELSEAMWELERSFEDFLINELHLYDLMGGYPDPYYYYDDYLYGNGYYNGYGNYGNYYHSNSNYGYGYDYNYGNSYDYYDYRNY